MSAHVTDTDHGYRALLKRLMGASERQADLTVGIHEGEGNVTAKGSDALTIVQLAAFHEFGLGDNERRSFIADWADEKEDEHRQQLVKMGQAIIKGTVPSVDVGLERLGNLYVGEIQRRIAQGIPPPLKQATINRKGSSIPLIDTGQLRSSIRYRVNGKGGPQSGG